MFENSPNQLQQISALVLLIITTYLAYLLFLKRFKSKVHFKQVQKNLEDICGPMFFKIKEIDSIYNARVREEKLNEFFVEFYDGAKVHQLGNRFAIKWLFSMHQKYNKFLKSRSDKDWYDFWQEFKDFQLIIEEEYWANFNVIFGDYVWYRSSINKNIFVRILGNTLRTLKELTEFLMISLFIFLSFILYDKYIVVKILNEESYLDNNYMVTTIFALIILVMAYFIIQVSGTMFLGFNGQKDGLMKNLLNKFTPKKFKEFIESNLVRSKSVRSKRNVPEKYRDENPFINM